MDANERARLEALENGLSNRIFQLGMVSVSGWFWENCRDEGWNWFRLRPGRDGKLIGHTGSGKVVLPDGLPEECKSGDVVFAPRGCFAERPNCVLVSNLHKVSSPEEIEKQVSDWLGVFASHKEAEDKLRKELEPIQDQLSALRREEAKAELKAKLAPLGIEIDRSSSMYDPRTYRGYDNFTIFVLVLLGGRQPLTPDEALKFKEMMGRSGPYYLDHFLWARTPSVGWLCGARDYGRDVGWGYEQLKPQDGEQIVVLGNNCD